MPTDLLLPAFALTLLANAVMIALAIRGLRRSRTDSAPTRDWLTPSPAAPAHDAAQAAAEAAATARRRLEAALAAQPVDAADHNDAPEPRPAGD